MAEFALGLTKTAVEGTLSLVKSAIEEEAKLKVKVQNDLMFITGEFQMMQSFLNIANKERAKNEVVRTWVRQVRSLAFDVEDCIEFVIHLDKSDRSWLRRLWHTVYCRAPPLPLDEAVAEIKQLKARVEDVSQRNTRYNLISDSGSNPKSMSVSAAEQSAATTAAAGASAVHILSEVWKESGKWRGMGDLAKLINSEGQELQVISVWGCREADHVASTIFRKAYDDAEICQKFKTRAWLKLKQPFTLTKFLRNLKAQFHWTSHQANEDVGNLTKAKYLIILEEVSSVVEWDAIKKHLPDSNNGSRIVLSTKQLGIALRCTGAPYQVSELVRFSNDQSLCAISKKVGRCSGKGQLFWQISQRGVISVHGHAGDIKSTVVHKVYSRIMHKSEKCHGVEFKRHHWVNVPDPFNFEVFSRRLLMNLRTEDLQLEEIAQIAAVGMMTDLNLITQECWKLLHDDEEDCLLVIDGLQSTHDWDLIKAAFISEPIRGCIVVITNEESVATRCADDEDGTLSMKDLEADPLLRSLVKGCQHYGTEGLDTSRRGRFLSIRREEAREWLKKKLPCNPKLMSAHGVTSVWGPDCAWKSDIFRQFYCWEIILCEQSSERMDGQYQDDKRFTMFSWVDVHHPFNLTDFSQRLLLDLLSDDLQAKRTAAVGIMEGQDPIQGSCKFLREYKCLVVINGLLTKHEWDLIKATFLSEPTKAHIIVITNEDCLATYVVTEEHRAFNVEDLEAKKVVHPLKKGFASRQFSDRSEEARELTNTFALVGNQVVSAYSLATSLDEPTSLGKSAVTFVWGIAGVGKSALVRSLYFHAMLGLRQSFECDRYFRIWEPRKMGVTMFSWVDVPHPFNLVELSCRLLLDFMSDDMLAKEAAAVGIVEGQDPIQSCRRVMHQHKCFIVIDGLRSTDDWDLIKATLLPDGTKATVIVITKEVSIAKHYGDNKKYKMVNVKGLEHDSAVNLFRKITWGCKDLTPKEKELSERCIDKCGGILKVIVDTGSFFANEIAYWEDRFFDMGLARILLDDSINCEFMETL